MPTTRSAKSLKNKRKIEDVADAPEHLQSTSKPRVLAVTSSSASGVTEPLPAVLTFSFEAAKKHLINADSRFNALFERLPCRPFEQLERVDPFRTLTSSILGQQISWLAARSIRHRFIRLYDPSLPEKLPADDSEAAKISDEFFPTAPQVADTDIATLKSAGLSTRKAEYVKDLASRFADERLTSAKLVAADDEELAELLIEVRGIGRWTVDMFALFSLRRPDILPLGDLGVQRGIIRWFLSLHSPSDSITISPRKSPKKPTAMSKDQEPPDLSSNGVQNIKGGVENQETVLVTPVEGTAQSHGETPDKVNSKTSPNTFPPSINKILKSNAHTADVIHADAERKSPVPLPEGLTVAALRSRLNGRKKIKGALLTPKEMEALTEAWRPYRSLGVYYMWALTEETTTDVI